MNELRSRILQLDPAFHSSEFGYHSFEDYLADAARAGIIEVDRRSSHGAIVASKSVRQAAQGTVGIERPHTATSWSWGHA